MFAFGWRIRANHVVIHVAGIRPHHGTNVRLQLGQIERAEASRRTLTISEFVKPALDRWIALKDTYKTDCGAKWANELGLFFTTEHGLPISNSNLAKDYRRILKQLGLADRRVYDLRHGVATYMHADGAT